MKIVIFGLTISSSWGNGHATLWRGLCRGLAQRSHRVVFFERDVPYYRSARDLCSLDSGELVLYESWPEICSRAALELADADAAIITSYCPDGAGATDLVLEAPRACRVFYDMDTPVTLAALERGERPNYLSERGLREFDLVLSFTGGKALEVLRDRYGARRVAALYGHVDPLVHRPVPVTDQFKSDLSYLGTYAEDRQAAVDELFLEPARRLPAQRFVLGGSMYPNAELWPPNVVHFTHVSPHEHATFFCSSRLTLNVTRRTMAEYGYCPSGRLFEAAACGVPIVSDYFEGLELFFEPDRELLVVRNREEVERALRLSDDHLSRMATRARERVLEQHHSFKRAERLEQLLNTATSPSRDSAAGRVTRSHPAEPDAFASEV